MIDYLHFDFGSEWRKKDLEGRINLARELLVDWKKLTKKLWDNYGKKFPTNSPEGGYISWLSHDGNRDADSLVYYIGKFDKGEIGDNFPVKNNDFSRNLWTVYYKTIAWIRHAEVYIRMKELEEKIK